MILSPRPLKLKLEQSTSPKKRTIVRDLLRFSYFWRCFANSRDIKKGSIKNFHAFSFPFSTYFSLLLFTSTKQYKKRSFKVFPENTKISTYTQTSHLLYWGCERGWRVWTTPPTTRRDLLTKLAAIDSSREYLLRTILFEKFHSSLTFTYIILSLSVPKQRRSIALDYVINGPR